MNPVVAAYTSNTLEGQTFSHVQLFEALLWSCEHNNLGLLKYLQTTPLEMRAAKVLPLITAIKHNSFEVGQHLIPLFKEQIFDVVKMFLWSRHKNTLSDPIQRTRWLNLLLPNSAYSALEKDILSTNKRDETCRQLYYLVLVLSPEELDQIPLLRFEQMDESIASTVRKNMFHICETGLSWCYIFENKRLNGADPVEKTHWFVEKFSNEVSQKRHSSVIEYELFTTALQSNFFKSARLFNQCNPKLEIGFNHLEQILLKNSVKTCLEALSVQNQIRYKPSELEQFFKHLTSECYGISPYGYSTEDDYTVLKTLLPYIQKMPPSTQKQFWRLYGEKASVVMVDHLGKLKAQGFQIPHINWDNNESSPGCFQNFSNFAEHLNEPYKMIRKNACSNPTVFSLPIEQLIEPRMFATICDSGNAVLVEKALECGAKMDIPQFNRICQYATPAALLRIFQTYVCAQVDLPKILSNWNHIWPFSICDLTNAQDFYQLDIIEQLDTPAATVLATHAIEAQRLDFLECVLKNAQTTPEDVWTTCANAKDPIFSHNVLECLITHLDPWFNNCEPLKIAVLKNNFAMLQRLVEVSDPRANNSDALVLAAQYGFREMVEFLLKHCPAKSQNSGALYWAIQYNRKDIAVMLLRESPVSENWVNRFEEQSQIDFFHECQSVVQAQMLTQAVSDCGVPQAKRLI